MSPEVYPIAALLEQPSFGDGITIDNSGQVTIEARGPESLQNFRSLAEHSLKLALRSL